MTEINTIRQSEKVEEKLQNLFKEHLKSFAQGDAQAEELRKVAMNHFMNAGIPSRFNENYKYTNLIPAFTADYRYFFTKSEAHKAAIESFHCDVPNLDTYNIYVVNGWVDEVLSHLNNLPKGVMIGSLASIARQNNQTFEAVYHKVANASKDSMVALNGAFAQDGIFISVADGVVLEKPIQVVNVFSAPSDAAIFQRNLVVVGKSAGVKLLYCDHTLTDTKFLINSVTEVLVEDNAQFDFSNIQNLHNQSVAINSLAISQQSNSRVQTNHINLHTGLSRNNIAVDLNGQNGEANMYGLYLCDKKQHVDNFTSISHNAPNCTSNELFKGVMDDSSTAAFSGRIYVAPDAQKTNAFQRNNNLLLTNDAKVNSKPQLEIYANDVKCSHGATVGQLDDKALFYLRSRGVGMDEARILLMYAFAYEVIEKIKVPALQEQIRDLVEKTFRGELNKCTSCVVCGKKDN